MKKKELAFRKQKKEKLSIIVPLAVVVVFCAFIFFKGYILSKDKSELEQSIDTLNTKIEAENKRSEDLKEYETYTHTKKYAEEVAKDVLGYVYKDEIVFKPE